MLNKGGDIVLLFMAFRLEVDFTHYFLRTPCSCHSHAPIHLDCFVPMDLDSIYYAEIILIRLASYI